MCCKLSLVIFHSSTIIKPPLEEVNASSLPLKENTIRREFRDIFRLCYKDHKKIFHKFIIKSSTTISCWLLDKNAARSATLESVLTVCCIIFEKTSHSLIILLFLLKDEIRYLLLNEIVINVILFKEHSVFCCKVREETFYNLIVVSPDSEAISRSLGEKATKTTEFVWFIRICCRAPNAVLYNLIS